jgi:hypothetical protein
MMKNLALAVFSVLFFLGVGEVICRVFPFTEERLPLDRQNFRADRAAKPDSLLGYSLRRGINVAGFRFNSLGFVGPEFEPIKPADTFRIICLGGSTTLGTGSDSDIYSYPAILQAIFDATSNGGTKRIQVLNAGVFGYHSWHTLLRILQRMDAFQPDMYLIMDGLNDLAAAKSMTLTQLERLEREGLGPLAALAPTTTLLAQADKVLTNLQLYRFLRNIFSSVPPSTMTGYGLDRIEKKFELFGYSRNIEKAALHAGSHGVSVVLVDYPWKIKPEMSADERAILAMHPEHEALYQFGRLTLPLINSNISKSLGIPLVTPQTVIDDHPPTRRAIRRVWADDIHLTRYGNYLLAKTIYHHLMSLPSFSDMTGRINAPSSAELDNYFGSLLAWRPSDGQGWPGPGWTPLQSSFISLDNIKDSSLDKSSGFSSWTPADISKPGRITLELLPSSVGGEAALYARVSGQESQVSVSTSGQEKLMLANTTGDGLWTPMAGWYAIEVTPNDRISMELLGENAQVWHRAEHVFFLPKPCKDK